LNRPAPKKVSEFTDLSVTYDVSVTGDPNDFSFLVEAFPTTEPDPSAPNVTNTMTNEIGFLPHVPDYLWTYILTLSDHFTRRPTEHFTPMSRPAPVTLLRRRRHLQ
jgi:hypothetical protein